MPCGTPNDSAPYLCKGSLNLFLVLPRCWCQQHPFNAETLLAYRCQFSENFVKPSYCSAYKLLKVDAQHVLHSPLGVGGSKRSADRCRLGTTNAEHTVPALRYLTTAHLSGPL